jgi:hypothetical protein
MKDSKVVWAWVGGVVVVVAIVGGVAWHFYRLAHAPKIGPAPVHASVGQVISGFPQGLILGSSSTQPTNSYSINYSSSTNQYTTEYNSSSSIASLYAQYQSYVVANGWIIINRADTTSIEGLTATNASSTATLVVIIVPQGKGSKATITYLAH